MDAGIRGDADAPLDYATIQILPSQNRYEVYTCIDNKLEKLTVGVLEKLLPHLPGLTNLHAKGSNANFKLQPPHNLESAAWFTASTLSRFLYIVTSTDLVDTAKVIEGEISQLEEDRNFHLSLYAQGHSDLSESNKTDTSNSADVVPTSKSEVQNSSSDTSKNGLLRAMDSRLTALRSELFAAFNQAVGETCSCEEVTHLAKFSENFGAKDVKKLLCTVLELSQKSPDANPSDGERPSVKGASMSDSITKTDENKQIAKAVNSETPVKYGVSPAKVARVERQSSSESEESSDSSDENQTSAERSRALIRSASPRRSASPMRRVQIGRSGSRRAPALTIKSLSYFPAREKILSHRDEASDDSEEEGSGHLKKPENDVRRMSVQDAINLFESKQRDQITDVPKKNSLTNISLGASKAVLRRWSAGMGESSQCQSKNASEDLAPETPDNVADSDIMRRSAEVNLDSDAENGVKNISETVDERLEESSYSPRNVQEATDVIQEEEANGRSKSSVEWSRQKEAELNQMLKKMLENQAVSTRKPQTNVRKNLPPEQRGGFYDHYKEKRDQKLRRENAGQWAEKEAKFKAMQKTLDERKAEMASTNVNNLCKKDPPKKPQKSVKNPQKLLQSSSQPANPGKEITKPSIAKKASSRTSPLPATRKSWPSTPSPRTVGTSLAKTSGGIPSTGTIPTRRKPQPSQSGSQPSPKLESSLPQRRNVKATQIDKRGNTCLNEKQKEKLIKSSKTTKTKAAATPRNSPTMVPVKSSLQNKVTKKSSVVPAIETNVKSISPKIKAETKPFLRKGSGLNSSVGVVNKVKSPSELEDSPKKTENSIDTQKSNVIVNASILVNEHQDQDVSSLDHCDDAMESETGVNAYQRLDVIDSVLEPAPDVDDGLKCIAEPLKCEEESTISPTAWVEIEEHQDLPHRCDDNAGELTSSVSMVPVGSASPRVRHSLSQMLQEESSEADTTEWGNAENPPAMIYQKDAPRGLKRLLKFARKSKGDANITGWSSPSVFSEGEDDTEESKTINKRNADNLLRKAALHAKNYGYENHSDAHELPSAQSGSISAATSTAKGTRSFFSLSAFRGSKPSEMKLR